MSEPQNLAPNLNEIMEEYDELENETVQATHVVTGQGEERAEVNDELKKIVEESRKRKRGNEEPESSEQKAGDCVSDMAYIAWRDKLQHRDFIGERGINKWVSPFQELVESKRWHLFWEHKAFGFVDVVKEFYSNMVGMKDKVVYVREKWIPFAKNRLTKCTIFRKEKWVKIQKTGGNT